MAAFRDAHVAACNVRNVAAAFRAVGSPEYLISQVRFPSVYSLLPAQ